MKKLTSSLLVLVLLLCLGAAPVSAAAADEICGSYMLIDMDDGSGEDYAALLAALASSGMTLQMEIREDGTATFNYIDSVMEFTFDFSKKTVTVEGETVPYTYSDGVLFFGSDEYSFTFTKSEHSVPRSRIPFTYYEFSRYVEDGKEVDMGDYSLICYLFDDGVCWLDNGGETIELIFDSESKTVNWPEGDEDSAIDFSLSGDELSLDDDGRSIILSLADPGCVGSYVMSDVTIDDDNAALYAMLIENGAMLLTIDEGGTGTMEYAGEAMTILFDFESMTATSAEDGGSIAFTYDNGTLTLDENGEGMTFRRVLSEEQVEEIEFAA